MRVEDLERVIDGNLWEMTRLAVKHGRKFLRGPKAVRELLEAAHGEKAWVGRGLGYLGMGNPEVDVQLD